MDLKAFEQWLRTEQGYATSTAAVRASLLRGFLREAGGQPDRRRALVLYAGSLDTKVSKVFRAAWRNYAAFEKSRGRELEAVVFPDGRKREDPLAAPPPLAVAELVARLATKIPLSEFEHLAWAGPPRLVERADDKSVLDLKRWVGEENRVIVAGIPRAVGAAALDWAWPGPNPERWGAYGSGARLVPARPGPGNGNIPMPVPKLRQLALLGRRMMVQEGKIASEADLPFIDEVG